MPDHVLQVFTLAGVATSQVWTCCCLKLNELELKPFSSSKSRKIMIHAIIDVWGNAAYNSIAGKQYKKQIVILI